MKSSPAKPKNHPKELIKSGNLFPVVGIGASAGGLDAFKKLVKAISDNSGMAYVLVQHLDPTHDSLLQEILQKSTTIPVIEISDDIKVQPNHIYVLPSNKMLVATDGVLSLTPRPIKNKKEQNLPIDLFFLSLAEVHQSHAIGVVLSGTASDGTQGLKAIKDHGGITFAQDEESAAYKEMPRNAVQAGVVDFILAPEKIPAKLLEIINIIAPTADDKQKLLLENEEVFRQIISLLHLKKGTDFTYYKQTTIRRRILRRMAFNKNEEPAEYLTYLRENKSEQDALYQDMLIPVTVFFRDPSTFDNLCKKVLPLIKKNIKVGEPIRIWVAGCSTGEEAYSIAICLKEFLGDNQGRVQIFATDISEPAIAKARSGVYTKIELNGVAPQRLNDFFTKTNGNYQVNRVIRDMCVFAAHNFLNDPPFSKMDLISCRNVLIYMNSYLQKKTITAFHYSLNPKGFLLLGKSETISAAPTLFTSTIKNDTLFTRKDGPGRSMYVKNQRIEGNPAPSTNKLRNETILTDFQKKADEIMLLKYMPAGVVVNEAMDIVHFRGNTSRYLQQSSGKPSHNLLSMAKYGLAFELRNILHKVEKEKISVIKESIPFQVDGVWFDVSIEAIPLPKTIEPYYLILFHGSDSTGYTPLSKSKNRGSIIKNDTNLHVRQLEQELVAVREDMRSITEDQEAANEELQSANEELLSSSEELQSLNEELETSKEELQSTNEELLVVNQELINLNEQVTESRDYAEAIVATMQGPLLVLDKNLRIKTANKSFYLTFQIKEHEIEGVLIYDVDDKQWNIPELRTLLEKILPEKTSLKNFQIRHTFSTIGERIMVLNALELVHNRSSEKLILLSIDDVTEREKAQEILNRSGEHLRQLVKELPAGVYSCDAEGRINFYNKAVAKLWGREPEIGKEFWCGSWKIFRPDGSPVLLDSCPMAVALKERRVIVGEELIIERPDGTRSNVLVHPQPEFSLSGELIGAINMVIDITEQTKANKIIEESQHRYREMVVELEKSVVERTYALKKANETLEEQNEDLSKMNKELESFAYVSSHDLQEPLRKIQTFSGLIAKTERQNLTNKGKEYFHWMQDAAKRMQTLIDDLLTFSRVNAAERIFESTDLNILIKEIKNELKEIIDEKHAVIEANELCPVTVVRFQFHQLLCNLISNALKFSNPTIPPYIIIKSEIIEAGTVKYENLSPQKKYFHICVQDNGIGFEPEFKDKIFEVFQKLHGKEKYAGTGIGLSIVKKIVENHNGIITATSELNEGARFDIYMPVS